MTVHLPVDPERYVEAIRQSGKSIYDEIAVGDPNYWIPTPELEALLDAGLKGLLLGDLPNRTRSKLAKVNVCHALGYPVPKAFKKTQPRFPGQFFDTYVQKANNLQVWNEELSGARRYVLIRVSEQGAVTRVKVVTGDTLAMLDTTGALTRKYQARCIPGPDAAELITSEDTDRLKAFISPLADLSTRSPVEYPRSGELLPIATLFDRLKPLIGQQFKDPGFGQERNRGAALHRLVCETLSYKKYHDDGQFPDVQHQLLEVKLQTSPTVDLGLVLPSSVEPLDVPMLGATQVRHRDVRYAVFYGRVIADRIELIHLFLSTGEAFLGRFPQFQGNVLNAKLQIPLPNNFFDR